MAFIYYQTDVKLLNAVHTVYYMEVCFIMFVISDYTASVFVKILFWLSVKFEVLHIQRCHTTDEVRITFMKSNILLN